RRARRADRPEALGERPIPRRARRLRPRQASGRPRRRSAGAALAAVRDEALRARPAEAADWYHALRPALRRLGYAERFDRIDPLLARRVIVGAGEEAELAGAVDRLRAHRLDLHAIDEERQLLVLDDDAQHILRSRSGLDGGDIRAGQQRLPVGAVLKAVDGG